MYTLRSAELKIARDNPAYFTVGLGPSSLYYCLDIEYKPHDHRHSSEFLIGARIIDLVQQIWCEVKQTPQQSDFKKTQNCHNGDDVLIGLLPEENWII